MASKKSLSQQKKEIRSHVDLIANTFHASGVSVAVLDAYKGSLSSAKKDGLASWYRGYSKRVGELLKHDSRDAALINGSMRSIERVIGVQL